MQKDVVVFDAMDTGIENLNRVPGLVKSFLESKPLRFVCPSGTLSFGKPKTKKQNHKGWGVCSSILVLMLKNSKPPVKNTRWERWRYGHNGKYPQKPAGLWFFDRVPSSPHFVLFDYNRKE